MEFKDLNNKEIISSEVDTEFPLIFKDIDNILDDMTFSNKEDRILCRTIIDSLEKEASVQLLEGKCVQLPYIGNIYRNKLKLAMTSHYKDLKEKRKELTKEEYKEYCRNIARKENMRIQNEEVAKRKLNTFKRKHLKMWMDKRNKFGDAYANLWLRFIKTWKDIPFNWDVEIAYQESYNQ